MQPDYAEVAKGIEGFKTAFGGKLYVDPTPTAVPNEQAMLLADVEATSIPDKYGDHAYFIYTLVFIGCQGVKVERNFFDTLRDARAFLRGLNVSH